jgi:hypothetical protein
MYNEFSFLLDNKINNTNNYDDIYGRIGASKERTSYDGKKYNTINIYKNKGTYVGTTGLKNFIKDKSYNNTDDKNPYTKLIEDFKSKKCLYLTAGDFAYLKDLGVYPLNRLFILRRFPEGYIVEKNLEESLNQQYPISTIVGWIEDGSDELFSLSFNEQWTTQTKMFHEVLGSILDQEFGIKGNMISAVPGFSQGFIFSILNKMGLTDNYDQNNIPAGDPNVLKEAPIRDGYDAESNFSLKSQLKVVLKTKYEQKIIGDVAPHLAMNDIINNLLKMGTSNTKFVLSNTNSTIIQQLLKANNDGNNINSWFNVIQTFIKKFISGLAKFIGSLTKSTDNNNDDGNKDNTPKQKPSIGQQLENGLDNVLKSLLASTIVKYRWPLRSSISVMTGLPSTPWHLTIGNPYNPIISINDIVIEDINLTFDNEFAFNDMPTGFKTDITVKMGRGMGAQEIFQIFNNSYQRLYNQSPPVKDILKNNEKDQKGNQNLT